MIPKSRVLIPVIGVCLLAFVGYICLWRAAPVMTSDSPSYMRVAGELGRLHLTQVHMRTPGYPLLLLLTGAAEHPTRLLFYFSLFAHFASVVMLGMLLEKLRIDRSWILLLAVAAVMPPFVEPAAYVMTEAPVELCLVLAFCASVLWISDTSRLYWILSILAIVAAGAIRPTYQTLSLVMAGGLALVYGVGLLRVSSSRQFMSVILSVAVVPPLLFLGYAWLNSRAFGYFGTSTIGPLALATKTASFVEYLPDTSSELRTILVEERDRYLVEPFDDHTAQDYIYRAYPRVKELYKGNDLVALKAIEDASLYLIVHKPMSYLVDSLKATAVYWFPFDVPLSSGSSGALRALWAAVQFGMVGIFFFQLVAVAGHGLFMGMRTWRTHQGAISIGVLEYAYGLGLVIIMFTWLLSCFLAIGAGRYRSPTDLLILATTIMGFTIWKRSGAVGCSPMKPSVVA